MASGTKKGMENSVITLEQLAQHGTRDSLWIAVYGHVYDLTSFSSTHPGGIEALESSAGTDGTESYEYAGHNDRSLRKMQRYCVGKLLGSTERIPAAPIGTPKPSKSPGVGDRKSGIYAAIKTVVPTIALLGILQVPFRRYLGSMLKFPHFQPIAAFGHDSRYAFLLGVAVASSVSIMALTRLYRQFLLSLDYENDVFSFPPTIPTRKRR